VAKFCRKQDLLANLKYSNTVEDKEEAIDKMDSAILFQNTAGKGRGTLTKKESLSFLTSTC
jgi:hypothetical protein